jgi:hypothetical protein
MPQIPGISRNRRLTPQGPIMGSSRGGGTAGRNLQEFAGQLNQLGKDLAPLLEDHVDKVEAHKAKNVLKRVDIEARMFAQSNANEDGSNLNELYQKKFEEGTKGQFENISGNTSDAISLIKDDFLTAGFEDMTQRHATMKIKKIDSDVQKELNGASSRVRLSPTSFKDEVASFDALVDSLPGLYGPENAQKAKDAARKEFALSSINGQVDKGNYNGAMKQIDTDFADIFDAEDALKLTSSIESKRIGDINRQIQLDSYERSQEIDDRNKIEQVTFDGYSARLADPAQARNRELIIKDAEEDFEKGLLSEIGLRAVKNAKITVQKTPVSNKYSTDLNVRISRGDESAAALRARVQRGLADGLISVPEAESMSARIDFTKDLIDKSPQVKRELKTSSDLIRKTIDPGGFLASSGSLDEGQLAALETSKDNYIAKGVRPIVAAERALADAGFSTQTKMTLQEIAEKKSKMLSNISSSTASDAEMIAFEAELDSLDREEVLLKARSGALNE